MRKKNRNKRRDECRPICVGTRKEMKIWEYQRTWRWVSLVREEDRTHGLR